MLGLAVEAAPPLAPTARAGAITGPLAALDAFSLHADYCAGTHDTASAIAGIAPTEFGGVHQLGHLVAGGHRYANAVTTRHAFDAGYTTLARRVRLAVSLAHQQHVGAQTCMDGWAAEGRPADRENCPEAAACKAPTGVLDMDARRSCSTPACLSALTKNWCGWDLTPSRCGGQRAAVCADDFRGAWRCATLRRWRISKKCWAQARSHPHDRRRLAINC